MKYSLLMFPDGIVLFRDNRLKDRTKNLLISINHAPKDMCKLTMNKTKCIDKGAHTREFHFNGLVWQVERALTFYPVVWVKQIQ
jgi:hypothetical protein